MSDESKGRDFIENAHGFVRQRLVFARGQIVSSVEGIRLLLERLKLRLDLRQRRLQRCAARRIRSALRKNVFALKCQGLPPSLRCGTFFGGEAPFLFAHAGLSGAHGLLGSAGNLLFHRFTFPTARHMFILRVN